MAWDTAAPWTYKDALVVADLNLDMIDEVRAVATSAIRGCAAREGQRACGIACAG